MHAEGASRLTGEGLFAYTTGVGQRLVSMMAGVVFDFTVDSHYDVLTACAVVYKRHARFLSDAIDQLVAIEVTAKRLANESAQDIENARASP